MVYVRCSMFLISIASLHKYLHFRCEYSNIFRIKGSDSNQVRFYFRLLISVHCIKTSITEYKVQFTIRPSKLMRLVALHHTDFICKCIALLCLFNIIIRLSLRNGYENEHSTDFYLLYFSEKQCALVLSKPHWSPYKRIQATGFLKLSNVSNAIPINAFEKRVSVFGPFFSTKNYTSLKEDNLDLVFSMNQTSNLLLEFFSYPFTFASKIHLENW